MAKRAQREKEAAESLAAAPDGYLYFLETSDGLFVKIGHSQNPRKRLSDIGAICPGIRLLGYIPGSRQDEADAHLKFYRSRDVGEWFRSSKKLQKFMLDASKREGFIRSLPPKQWIRWANGVQIGVDTKMYKQMSKS